MFPFWEIAVAPVLEAAQARRIVEIGALRGENTQLMLDRLGPDTVLHVIDPVPEFDPAEHERRFAGQYVFHRGLSLDVLPGLEPMDAALVDGDHNWYTVYNELRLLRDAARGAGQALPVLILHDVLWPYGRRDLYYAPDTIPEEFRQPYRRAGMRMGRKRLLLAQGGLNPTLCNAEVEGGARNGVMTAVDDFMAEHDRALVRVVLPVYFGLAIVVEEERLARQPELAAVIERLQTSDGKDALLELAEDIRIRGMIFQHNIFYQKQRSIEHLSQRYLDSIKRGLLDEYYLENELRVAHLADCLGRGAVPDVNRLRDPARYEVENMRRLRNSRRTGSGPDDGAGPPAGFPFTTVGRVGLDSLESCLDRLRDDTVPGDLAECGTGRGGGAIFLRAYLEAHDVTDRQVWVVDRFRAAPDDKAVADLADGVTQLRPDLNTVRDGFERFDLLDDRVRFVQGDYAATLVDAPIEQLALLRIGSGIGGSLRTILDRLYDRLAIGGFVVIEDALDPATRAALDGFRTDHAPTMVEERTGWAGTAWRKTAADRPVGAVASSARLGMSSVPLAPPAPAVTTDLSVVVVVYDMRREAARSLHALSRAYQLGVDDLDYEVVVVENGSHPDQRLGEAYVASFGPNFRYLDLGADATPSPANALNRGIAAASGTSFALMIDGAHVITPGLLRHGMAALATYDPAIVATQQWYIGPGQQGDAMQLGYDQDYEDKLFEKVEWPADGYRLFDIGHFIGNRDWFDGVWESNCLFVRRSLLEQAGGFDEGFSTPGGGYTNLELYERLAASPDVTVASILGEGSFHQIHGGTTTNLSDPAERRLRVFSYSQHFAELRGRAFTGPEKPIYYVGGFEIPSAKRSRARRMSAAAFAVDYDKEGVGDRGDQHAPVPDELKDAFIEAYWRSSAWKRTYWLGRPVLNAPTDLIAYEEIISEVGPDWIIETGTGNGGRALFLASMCDLVGKGGVVSVDSRAEPDLPTHPRITYVTGVAHEPSTVRQVAEVVGEAPKGMVILGTRGARMRMRCEFEAYAPFVAVGSYAIMENTVVNGHPVHAAFGPGPFEAVRRVLGLYGDFVADTEREKFTLTFNPNGFLRRVR